MPGAQRHVWKISLKEEFQWILKKKKKVWNYCMHLRNIRIKKKTLLNRENLTYRGLNCDIRWNHARNIVFLQHKAKGRWWGMKIMGWNEGFVLWVMKLLKDFKVGMMIWFPSRIVSIPVDVITRPICPVDRPWGKKKKKTPQRVSNALAKVPV